MNRSTTRRFILFCLLTGSGTLCAYSQAPSTVPRPAEAMNASDTGSYVLGPLDTVQITVFGAPDLSTLARISQSGEVVVPLVGVVKIGDLTVSQASALLTEKIESAKLVNDPHIEIFVRDYQSQKVTVAGAVKAPTVVHMLAPMTLGDVLSAAGGVDPLYGGSQVEITRGPRALGNHFEAKSELDLRVSESMTQLVFPGDVVRVPQAGVVYVVGAVKKPGGFTLAANDHLSVLQALALAEGLDTAASKSKAVILRRGADEQEPIAVNLGRVLDRKDPNLTLSPNDILYIPRSGTKLAMERTVDAIVNIASGVVIYRGIP